MVCELYLNKAVNKKEKKACDYKVGFQGKLPGLDTFKPELSKTCEHYI